LGHEFKAEAAPLAGEIVVAKQVNNAFVGTCLEGLLRESGCGEVAVCGVITNNSLEATVRHGAHLGFRMVLAEDARFTFGRADWSGKWPSAQEVHDMSVANLAGEYCRVATAAELLGSC
jgi:nicotinamidase-related amidase